MGARGFGSLRAPFSIEEPENPEIAAAKYLKAIKERVCLPAEWREVPVVVSAAGFATDANFNGAVFDCLTVTVKTGTIYVWHRQNNNANQTPDYIFSASDTKQIALAPRAWDTWSFYASGGAAEAMLVFGNV
jgi:hypothetical protein